MITLFMYTASLASNERNKSKKKVYPLLLILIAPPILNQKKTDENKNIFSIQHNVNPRRNPSNHTFSPDLTSPQPKPNLNLIILMKKQIVKEVPLTKIINSSLIDLPSPSSISFL
jgi:hypothetical protein